MTFKNSQFDDSQLDLLLKQYGEANPRAGLESRVLTRLASERERRVHQWGWRWVVAGLAMGVVVGAGLLLRHNPVSHTTTVVMPDTVPTTGTKMPDRAVAARRPRTSPAQIKRPSRVLQSSSEPRQERFPSAAPLSNQEEMLARYIQDSPAQAKLIARAQTELRLRDTKEFERLGEPVQSQQKSEP